MRLPIRINWNRCGDCEARICGISTGSFLNPEVQVACTEVPVPDLTLVRQKLEEFLNTAEQHTPAASE